MGSQQTSSLLHFYKPRLLEALAICVVQEMGVGELAGLLQQCVQCLGASSGGVTLIFHVNKPATRSTCAWVHHCNGRTLQVDDGSRGSKHSRVNP